ncbi:MAG: hypothetical protein KGI39_03875 [Patescibacteria group bacterium]|nr:hypothetical protein [Patescibacteria group bacterium]
MSRKRGSKGNLFFSEHHSTPKSKGGRGKDKKIVPHDKHLAWHILVKDALPEEAAEILSYWIRRDSRFFAIMRGESIYKIYKTVQEINRWLEDSDIKMKVVLKRSKIIQFRPRENSRLLPKIVS